MTTLDELHHRARTFARVRADYRVARAGGSPQDAPLWLLGVVIAGGLLIGTDIRIGLSTPTSAEVVVIGRPDLTELYAAAIGQSGRRATELDGERWFLPGVVEIAKRMS